MSDNEADVILVTADPALRDSVVRQCPPGTRLRCCQPGELEGDPLPAAPHWWVDLDCPALPRIGPSRRRVYFYSRLPAWRDKLPSGLFLRKPCTASSIAVLWAGAAVAAGDGAAVGGSSVGCGAGPLPGWLIELHELDLRNLCHKCVGGLPARLGYEQIALYLYDAQQDVLRLAEASATQAVDLAVPLELRNDHVFAGVVRSGSPLITQDLAQTCRLSRFRCPSGLGSASAVPALIAPLLAAGSLQGLVALYGRRAAGASSDVLPLEPVFAFLGRCIEHARRYEQARLEARVDLLTGLFNYRWMIEALRKEIHRAQRYNAPLAVIMLDLDGLKAVNDRFGHSAGDALLRHVAGKVGAALRQTDSAARVGGDEFVVLLPATDVNGGRLVAERILAAIRGDAPLVRGQALPVAASLGVAQWREGWNENRLLEAADQAMYAAKREGSGHLVCHPHPQAGPVAAHLPALVD